MGRVLLLLAGTVGIGACCQPPADGPLAPGAWGGADNQLTVTQDGTAALMLGCEYGYADDRIEVADGSFTATFSFDPDGWGPDAPGDEPAFPVTVTGDVCGGKIVGEAVLPDATVDLVLKEGKEPEIPPCAE